MLVVGRGERELGGEDKSIDTVSQKTQAAKRQFPLLDEGFTPLLTRRRRI